MDAGGAVPGFGNGRPVFTAAAAAPLTARAVAWYREERCQDCVTDVRSVNIDIKAGL
jgi:hypothetical protein